MAKKATKKVTKVKEPEVTTELQQETKVEVSVNELLILAQFLESLASTNRLSNVEQQGIKPAFDKLARFLEAALAQN